MRLTSQILDDRTPGSTLTLDPQAALSRELEHGDRQDKQRAHQQMYRSCQSCHDAFQPQPHDHQRANEASEDHGAGKATTQVDSILQDPLEQCFRHVPAAGRAAMASDGSAQDMWDEHWTLTEELLPVLQPLQIATSLLSDEETPAASIVFMMLWKLVQQDMALQFCSFTKQ